MDGLQPLSSFGFCLGAPPCLCWAHVFLKCCGTSWERTAKQKPDSQPILLMDLLQFKGATEAWTWMTFHVLHFFHHVCKLNKKTLVPALTALSKVHRPTPSRHPSSSVPNTEHAYVAQAWCNDTSPEMLNAAQAHTHCTHTRTLHMYTSTWARFCTRTLDVGLALILVLAGAASSFLPPKIEKPAMQWYTGSNLNVQAWAYYKQGHSAGIGEAKASSTALIQTLLLCCFPAGWPVPSFTPEPACISGVMSNL